MKDLIALVKRLNPIYISLICSSIFGVTLLLFRPYFSGSFTFLFLIWNLFLAYIPLGIALFVKRLDSKKKIKLIWLLPFIGLWLLFLPNAPYILTDLFHLKQRNVPLWFDLVTLLSFAWNGLFAGFISLNIMHKVVQKRYSTFLGWSFVCISIVASSFGIFLGRYLRWNSWDIIHQPSKILLDVMNPILHPFQNINSVGMTMTFSLLLFFMYSMIRFKENGVLLEN